MDVWEKVQVIGARSSDRQDYDHRAYGTALSEEGYPNIAQWCRGHWSEENQAECLRLLRDSLRRGSRPLLQVAMLVLGEAPTVKRSLWGQLTDEERQKATSMIAIMN